ncbi:hypothetical protein HD597_001119 [Nonomuraea thailandensis]|uniref:Uncharacterized protein n=1 Tax=Nonomuraea thailandensis TaxID=1188745 RepID=A0A9X2JZD9_9ACTN|nr:hypothetical protein [Nonomuraea thailandensis]MCP2354099.1 hypothetical protein [Nonomuraea thailandensis]
MFLTTVKVLAMTGACLNFALGLHMLITNRVPRPFSRRQQRRPRLFGAGLMLVGTGVVPMVANSMLPDLPLELSLALVVASAGCLLSGPVLVAMSVSGVSPPPR